MRNVLDVRVDSSAFGEEVAVVCVVLDQLVREACTSDRSPPGILIRGSFCAEQEVGTYLATSFMTALTYGSDSISSNSGILEGPTTRSISACAFFITSGWCSIATGSKSFNHRAAFTRDQRDVRRKISIVIIDCKICQLHPLSIDTESTPYRPHARVPGTSERVRHLEIGHPKLLLSL